MNKGIKMLSADDGIFNSGGTCRWLLDIDDQGVKVLAICGRKPYARPFIAAIVECPEVKEAIKTFLTESDDSLYKMDVYEGVSGCRDLILRTANYIKGFEVINSKTVLHITMCDKVDRNYYKFSFRELIEIAGYFDLLTSQSRIESCQGEEVSYFNPKKIDSTFYRGSEVILD